MIESIRISFIILVFLNLQFCFGKLTENKYSNGCLINKKDGWKKPRVCNSDDQTEVGETSQCEESKLDYKEIRISIESWETVVLEAWILQIILSEILDVPTSIEAGDPNLNMNFYNSENFYKLGPENDDFGCVTTATEYGDCRKANKDPKNYEPCCHVIPEVWYYDDITNEMISNGTMETPTNLGAVSQEALYIPKFTAVDDPSLTSYLGMTGEKNRKKLAEKFKRPFTWEDYCSLISENNCVTDDGVAKRSPNTSDEHSKYFLKDLYTGYFNATDDNDCSNNQACTGHITDFPDGWVTYVFPQTHYLDISLKSNGSGKANGYQYEQLQDIWRAANATKSNVIMMLWNMDPTYIEFVGSDAEFTKVNFPTMTQECKEARISYEDRISGNLTRQLGDPAGTCDGFLTLLTKGISTGLVDNKSAVLSPAQEAVRSFQMTELQLMQLVKQTGRISLREAVCQWVDKNFEDIKRRFIPPTHPRVMQFDRGTSALYYFSVLLGIVSLILVLATGILTFLYRETNSVKFAQTDFLFMILTGLLATSIGSTIIPIPPTESLCVTRIWMINIGLSLELVPLIVKVGTVIQIMNAAKKLKRVIVPRKNLYQTVFIICGLVVLVLAFWSAFDPPVGMKQFRITNMKTKEDDYIIKVGHYCNSKSNTWQYIAHIWTITLLLCTSVLSAQMRSVRKNFNESLPLAVMTYSHFIFEIMQVMTHLLPESVSQVDISYVRSLLYSTDTIATVVIYFIPKFLTSNQESDTSKLSNGNKQESKNPTSDDCGGDRNKAKSDLITSSQSEMLQKGL
eukprot:CAMPEP_0194276232 /NCGR_PEP_ID=MMETSP0169-20130528/8874_1 /TAXON_ID=218684 /ORGANISM="Corethron pennatum, Strain L29A3" /LENGTH=796 /DNA_ID=CAMNT_0039019897 /DNA_START=74 /DNA_END=2464 /DNA_ORIENTATION=+